MLTVIIIIAIMNMVILMDGCNGGLNFMFCLYKLFSSKNVLMFLTVSM